MPRKKENSQKTLGALLGLRMSSADRKKTLDTLSGLPYFYYALLCQTEDQKRTFIDFKQGYQYIKADISAVFAGEETVYPRPLEHQDFWGLMSDRYLAWYMVVSRGWSYLYEEWASDERIASYEVESPGDALIRLLEHECAGFMEPMFSDKYRFAPSQHRKWAKNERDIARSEASEKTKKAVAAEITIKGLRLEAFVFGELCIETCRMNAKNDERLKISLKHYDTVMSALDRKVQSMLHPRKNFQGYEWRGGTKYKINRYGPSNERFYS